MIDKPNSALLDLYITGTVANFYCYVLVESSREWQFVGKDGGMIHVEQI